MVKNIMKTYDEVEKADLASITSAEVCEGCAEFADRDAHGCASRSQERFRLRNQHTLRRPFSQVAALLFLRFYRYFISPLLGTNRCRFEPTCSKYAIEAIKIHGSLKGCYYSARRLLRCHPWHPGGNDPIP